jgi:hypothetical protein
MAGRRRWIYIDGVAYEEGVDQIPERNSLSNHNRVVGDSHYDGLRATDGTPIDTRTKHREYMKRHNVTTMDDFNSTWQKALKQKADYVTKGGTVKREHIERAIHELQRRK